jgi:hypothetical protein
MPKVPAIPASLAAIVTMLGLGLMYWSMLGLGLLTPAGATTSTGGGIGTSATGSGSTGSTGGTLAIPGGPAGIRKYVSPTGGGGGAKLA